jgi:hypothetical protein
MDWYWKWEEEWSCSQHDYPDFGCDCCGEGACPECEYSTWNWTVDEDGWWTLTFYEPTMLEKILKQVYLPPIVEQLNKESLLLSTLKFP